METLFSPALNFYCLNLALNLEETRWTLVNSRKFNGVDNSKMLKMDVAEKMNLIKKQIKSIYYPGISADNGKSFDISGLISSNQPISGFSFFRFIFFLEIITFFPIMGIYRSVLVSLR